MKTSLTSIRAALCILVVLAATAIASATTITFSGLFTQSVVGPYAVNDTWQLTVVLADPLVDTSGGADLGRFLYVPVSMTMAVDGTVILSDFNFGSQVEGSHGYLGSYFTQVLGSSHDGGFSLFTVAVGLGSSSPVTAANGLLLPGLPMNGFEGNTMWLIDSTALTVYAGGVVTGYTVETGTPVPDAGATVLLLGLGCVALAAGRRRGAR